MSEAVPVQADAVQADPPRASRRLSPVRVLLSMLLVGVLSVGGYLGVQMWTAARASEAYTPWFAGYTDVTATPTFNFETPASNAGRDVVLSFIVAATDAPCVPTWGTAFTLDEASESLDLDRRLARTEKLGGQVVVSFGGLRNDELSTVCTDPGNLVDAYAAVVDRYQVTTIDLDIEAENLSDTAAGLRRATAIKTLQEQRRKDGKDLAVWLTLPVAPAGMTEQGTDAVSQMLNAGVDLAGVNLMTMDYGSSRAEGDSMATASIAALKAGHRQLGALCARAGTDLTDATLWSKIGATPMIGQNDVPSEVFSLKDATRLSRFAQENKIGRMSMWSLNRDQTCGSNYADLKRVSDSCSGVSQGETRFADLLAKGFTGRPEASASTTTTDETDKIGDLTDDPETSPYPIWAAEASYLSETKIVWHRNVYQAKWWTRGDLPDNPVLNAWETLWTLIGPVLPGEKPIQAPSLPAGTYPSWDGAATYQKGDRILLGGAPFEAKWWNQAESPEAAFSNPDGSPWTPLSAAEVAALLATPPPAPVVPAPLAPAPVVPAPAATTDAPTPAPTPAG
ncbi:glycosyl hydrolase family 18 [Cryobacterium sp. TmT2-59]|uniref:chitinase n=1 Tax=Cryobacterium sp. TmT2-59 TaxID=1259264 RepID=UPI00106DBA8A|nr:chitinase [Cryobacterium sp. TmT2-59]TFC88911.1 glycosyl hydrolase family 18 [Cryobacterium sp. TmT2-59]